MQFGNLFGGERFVDLIGEISLLKDFGKASEIMMTDEEKAELEKSMQDDAKKGPGESSKNATTDGTSAATTASDEAASDDNAVNAAPTTTASNSTPTSSATTGKVGPTTATDSTPAAGTTSSSSTSSQHLSTQDASGTATPTGGKATSRTKPKLTVEQRQKLEALEKEKREAEEKRIADLTSKLKDRIRPFVEARNPGDKDDSETQLFGKRMREEAEDLKLESFGVELLHTIGNIYLTKSTTWVKSQRHNFLGLPGFFSRLKEKGSQVKETWGLMGSAMSVLVSMEDIQRRQEKGDIDEEEMRQLEQDMSSKMLLATWRGTRSEVNGVLRKVCDNVLYEKGVDQKTLLNRARALAYLGAIYKQVQPEEGDEERRELERLVAEAAGKNKKKKEKKGKKDLGASASASGPGSGPAPATSASASASETTSPQ